MIRTKHRIIKARTDMASLRYESQVRPPLIDGNKDYHQVTEDIIRPIEARPSKLWWLGFLISVGLLTFGAISVTHEVIYGVGQWNLNKTIGWGWDITNFVWWVGIGHAGTLISAILLLFRQGWRTGVNRAAEAMTIFAVMCAGQFPIWHMGRVWMAFFVFPYPNTRGSLWPNFNSPLMWDVLYHTLQREIASLKCSRCVLIVVYHHLHSHWFGHRRSVPSQPPTSKGIQSKGPPSSIFRRTIILPKQRCHRGHVKLGNSNQGPS